MNKRQRIFFRIGAWTCLVTAVAHMAGQLAPRPAPADEAEATLRRLLQTYQKDMGAGMMRTTSDFLNGFSIAFAISLAWVGVVALMLLRHRRDDAALLVGIARVYAFFAAVMLAVSAVDFFLPPTVCLAIIVIGFAGAAMGAGRVEGRTS